MVLLLIVIKSKLKPFMKFLNLMEKKLQQKQGNFMKIILASRDILNLNLF